jgi:pyrroloquinoline quinone biosynthesis protein D
MSEADAQAVPAVEIPSSARVRLTAKAMMRTDKVTGNPMLLYPEGALALNPTGAAIVELCDGRRTFGELVAALAERYKAPVEKLRPDVAGYIRRLKERGLVEVVGGGSPA